MASFTGFLRRRLQSIAAVNTRNHPSIVSPTQPTIQEATSLRILAIPVAIRRRIGSPNASTTHGNEALLWFYALPVQNTTQSTSKRALVEVVGVWKSGLWAVSRVYRAIWNAVFSPQPLPSSTRIGESTVPTTTPKSNSSTATTLEGSGSMQRTGFDDFDRVPFPLRTWRRVQLRVFQWSDQLVSRWCSTFEEDFLRQVDTHAQVLKFEALHFRLNKFVFNDKICTHYPFFSFSLLRHNHSIDYVFTPCTLLIMFSIVQHVRRLIMSVHLARC
jgi:hypothetical protein